MYLSRVELDVTRRATMRALAAPQKLHGAVESAFPGERRRRLWRLDHWNGKLYLLLLSEDQPNLLEISDQFGPVNRQGSTEIREYNQLLERIVPGSVWQFRLTANPTKSCAGEAGAEHRGKVLAHCTVEYQEKWLLDRAEKHGFRLEPDGFTVTASRWLHFAKGGMQNRTVSLLSVTYEGVLQVTEPDLFRTLLTSGIGRGKAYGLGLMTVIHRG
ncbi:type I-E CRISPR-associated protein Cas6/Cse3/CasE [uncultured Gemmiger sp.]|uniref:type I-E CRISPR-associated protein Cas6/Cse3/CasE n=1 Tax=uncultured Gemmiger sp. TaxID=1623490 RepID=UPI0025ECA87F|nr:type I-E CRISPR-associated protein Cas6/Cse3/CasE [uncultured Gemmiger sp.]